MNRAQHEKRRYSRAHFDCNVTLINPTAQWQCRLIDISLKGALVERPGGWEGNIGDQYTLELPPGNTEVVIRMTVIIARTDHDHIGFYCKNIDFDSIIHLKRLIEINIGDAGLVNRELSALG